MEIKKISLRTNQIEAIHGFYQILGLKTQSHGNRSISIPIGASYLEFIQSELNAYYHFAINIPSFQIQDAVEWLKNKVNTIPLQGSEIVDFPNWNAESVYFHDPAGNIVELIARKNLGIYSDNSFSANSLLYISEMGVATSDVRDCYHAISKPTGIEQYSGDLERFCAAGDEQGLFIIADYNRKKWIPNMDDPIPFPFEIEIEVKGREYAMLYSNERISFLGSPS